MYVCVHIYIIYATYSEWVCTQNNMVQEFIGLGSMGSHHRGGLWVLFHIIKFMNAQASKVWACTLVDIWLTVVIPSTVVMGSTRTSTSPDNKPSFCGIARDRDSTVLFTPDMNTCSPRSSDTLEWWLLLSTDFVWINTQKVHIMWQWMNTCTHICT